jgi:HPr kinase/phosphorylase
MEVRGLGVINIQDLFGIAATRTSKRIELVVQLERWETRHDSDRLGLGEERFHILNLPLPLIRMPVAPGRNLAILVEIAARNQLLRARGHHAAKKLADRLEHQLQLAGLDEIDESEIEDVPDSGEEQ